MKISFQELAVEKKWAAKGASGQKLLFAAIWHDWIHLSMTGFKHCN